MKLLMSLPHPRQWSPFLGHKQRSRMGNDQVAHSQTLGAGWEGADEVGSSLPGLLCGRPELHEEPFVLPLSSQYSCSVFYFQLNFY